MIAAFPTWASDQYPATYADRKGVYYRNAWEAFGITVPEDKPTAKAMHDERGYRPFEMVPGSEGLPDYDRVVPAFFRSLDRKMQHLNDQGFVAMLETIRRDVAPPWKAYFDFNESYARFLQYMVARYGAYNMIFSKVHFDIYLPKYSLTAAEFNEAINHHYRKYGPMPFGQPVTSLIDHATDTTFGTGEQAPWITMHSTGNKPRDHAIYAAIERQFRLVARPADGRPGAALHGLGARQQRRGRRAGRIGLRPRQLLLPRADVRLRAVGRAGGPRARHGRVRRDQRGRAAWTAALLLAGPAVRVGGRTCADWGPSSSRRARATGTCNSPPTTCPRGRRRAVPRRGWTAGPSSCARRTRGSGCCTSRTRPSAAATAGWRPDSRYRFTWFDPRAGAWRRINRTAVGRRRVMPLPPFPGGQDVAGHGLGGEDRGAVTGASHEVRNGPAPARSGVPAARRSTARLPGRA